VAVDSCKSTDGWPLGCGSGSASGSWQAGARSSVGPDIYAATELRGEQRDALRAGQPLRAVVSAFRFGVRENSSEIHTGHAGQSGIGLQTA